VVPPDYPTAFESIPAGYTPPEPATPEMFNLFFDSFLIAL
jgi:hypothetical protein